MASDLLRIGANIQAMRSLSSLMKTNEAIGNHQYRLSTGKRINSAQDDTAGYSIAKELQSRVSGLKQANSNVGNAKSILAIAEGGYQAQMSILQSIKDKVVQAADDALDSGQRTSITNQVTALLHELDDVSSQTKWNGSTLFTASAKTFHVGGDAGDTLAVTLDTSTSAAVGDNNTDLSGISLASAASASAAITSVDSAITSLSESIQTVGDYQARLSSKENTLSISITNTEAVRSTIEDADFAREQMQVMKLQIIQQTALSSFAQANAAPQTVLSLFR
ncbi:MAG: flagellin [FCB group bacterium]|nr:flagellin [FCB group bacterium]